MPFRDTLRRRAFRVSAAAGAVGLAAVAAYGVAALSNSAAADTAGPEYAAVGDSYTSGTGAGDYLGDGECGRSEHAYPVGVADDLGDKLWFDACAGADTADVLAGQLDHLGDDTEHVTIGVGGNDIGFSPVMKACSGSDDQACADAIEGANADIADKLPSRLDEVYTRVEAEAAGAVIVVVGYPRLFDGSTCDATVGITAEEQAALNDMVDLLDETIADAAARHELAFADPRPAFADHAICSDEPWLLGYEGDGTGSFHPNAAGHSGYADVVLAYPYE